MELRALQGALRVAQVKAEDVYNGLPAELADKKREIEAEIRVAEQRVAEINRDNQADAVTLKFEQAQLATESADASTKGNAQRHADLNRIINEKTTEYTKRHALRTSELNRLNQAVLPKLQLEQQRINAMISEDRNRRMNEDAPQVLLDAEEAVKSVLDDAGKLERRLKASDAASEVLVEEVKADFEQKQDLFDAAETLHTKEARLMLYVMVAIVFGVAAVIYFLFVKQTGGLIADGSSRGGALPIVESLVLLGTGRIALLILGGWALKYIAELHRAHAEQAVIYRDRKAALGVAQTLLVAAPELEQKRETLKMLADGYLNFEQSAFRGRRPRDKESDMDATIDRQIKHVKDVVDAVKPLVEPVGKAVEKTK